MSPKAKKRLKTAATPRATTSLRFADSRLLHFLLLSALCLVLYADTVSGEFVWDDPLQVVRNEEIRSLDNIPKMFSSPLWSFAQKTDMQSNRYYRPVQTLLFAVVYQFNGLAPFGYHVLNILLHFGSTIMVYLLCVELGSSRSEALLAGVLFAVHPVHSGAVAWISGLGEVACGLFYFAALWTLLVYFRNRRAWVAAASMLCLFIALLAKEMAVTFPFVAFLLILMKQPNPKFNLRGAAALTIPYIAVLIVYGVIRIAVVGGSQPATFLEHASALDWLTLIPWLLGKYLRYAFVPYPLVGLHLTPLYLKDRYVSSAIYVLLIASVPSLLFLARRVVHNGLLWFAMFTVMLAPAFYLKAITGGSIFAERYLYIPTLPAVAILSLLIVRLPSRAALATALALLAIFSVETVIRNRDWQNDRVFYSRAVAVYPENALGWIGLGTATVNAGDYTEAKRDFEMAERYMADDRFVKLPDYEYRVHLGLGTVAAQLQNSEQAKAHLRRALEVKPSGSEAYSILAGVLSNLDRNPEGAIPFLEKAMALDPVDDQARDSMGVALYNLRRYEEAAVYFREALRINPESQLAQQHLQTVLRRLGQ
jgi:tetratricopeptide (TPR) repeat protein